MRRIRWATIGLAVALLGSVTVGTTAATGLPGRAAAEKPTATEVGVTPTEIHVAVVADVDNSIAPNLFAGSRDGVLGYAKYVNQTGGIAGRKLVVDFYDSKLNPNETRNAEIQACQNDLAMVGTSSVFLVGVDDMRSCKDKAGAATGIPDIPVVSTARCRRVPTSRSRSRGHSSSARPQNDHPQTYVAGRSGALVPMKNVEKDLHGVYIFGPTRSRAAVDSAFAHARSAPRHRHQVRQRLRPQRRRAAVRIHRDRPDHQEQGLELRAVHRPYTCTVLLRKEATLQGVNSVKVWDCAGQCYDPKFLTSGGPDVEGEYVTLNYLPFLDKKEQKANKALGNFVKYTGATKVDGFGAYAWPAADAFRQAIDSIVKKDGVNGITRQAIFGALNGMHDFDAGGDPRHDRPRRRQTHELLRAAPGAQRAVRPGVPEEARHHVVHSEERARREARHLLNELPKGRARIRIVARRRTRTAPAGCA